MGRNVALIVAAGSGTRMGGALPKQYQPLGGIPVLRRAVMPFADHPRIDAICVVVADGWVEDAHRAIGGSFTADVLVGGQTRGESVDKGRRALYGDAGLLH